MDVYEPPIRPGETYSQGYWYAVIAAILYMIGSTILMVNMLGYFLGKYPQHFELDDDQRTLILQTMMFFFWLAGGAAVFQKVCGWSYADALYFCDVTILTVGFGDFVAPNDTGRGLVFPYSVIGIIFLGLMISSIRKFAISMSTDNIVKAHERHQRERTIGRSVSNEKELRDKLGLPPRPALDDRRLSDATRTLNDREQSLHESENPRRRNSLSQYGHFDIQGSHITFQERNEPVAAAGRGGAGRRLKMSRSDSSGMALDRDEGAGVANETGAGYRRRAERRKKLLLLKEEKDRFDAMRAIQQNTKKFRKYTALAMSVLAFGLLWCLGALVFMIVEHREQNLSYFEGLYFCYVSLLTIGYGDFAPHSNAGKPFFVIWSLVAIPTMTILISDMGDTVVSAINHGTFTLADWTIMPKKGAWLDFLQSHPRLKLWLENYAKAREEKKRVKRGFMVADPEEDLETGSIVNAVTRPTLQQLAREGTSEHELARKLARAIKRVAQDLRADQHKKYSYEEWVEFTRLIRFTATSRRDLETEEGEEGLIDWDWIGEDSPMLSDDGEPQWILDRLCESLNRYTRRQARRASRDHPASHSAGHRHRSRSRNLEEQDESSEGDSSSGMSHGAIVDDRRDAPRHTILGADVERIDHHARSMQSDRTATSEERQKMYPHSESESDKRWKTRIATERNSRAEDARRSRDDGE
ncbi:MAG: Potassium channel [Claussenomyces sp. TS43310]|nr:MAG: Potassium channel [Claussenomyces sp. TS43310]